MWTWELWEVIRSQGGSPLGWDQRPLQSSLVPFCSGKSELLDELLDDICASGRGSEQTPRLRCLDRGLPNLQNCEESQCMWFKPPGLWYFVVAA